LYEYAKDIYEGELHPSRIIYTGYEEGGTIEQEGFYTIHFDYDLLNNSDLKQTFYCQKGINEYMNLSSVILKSIDIRYTEAYSAFKQYFFNYARNYYPDPSVLTN
jgi:hypothetical protein